MNLSYKDLNLKSWNQRTELHLESDFYDNENFKKGRNSLNPIEIGLLGDITNKSILHLQCHFGQDTISLNMLGAKSTGIDFSNKSIDCAHELAKTVKSDASFICSDIYDLSNKLNKKYDVIYTSYGAIQWLPDLNKWAQIIHDFLKPNGKFVMVEFHPIIGMLNREKTEIADSYFNNGPITEDLDRVVSEHNNGLKTKGVTWNHETSTVINSLVKHGLNIDSFNEYDYSFYNCYNGMEEFYPGKFRFRSFKNQIPIMYSLVARKINPVHPLL